MRKKRKTKQWIIVSSAVFFVAASNSLMVYAFDAIADAGAAEMTSSDGGTVTDSAGFEMSEAVPEVWTETYTYLADTQESHATFGIIKKEGEFYEPSDVQYQVTTITQSVSQNSAEMWAYEPYEPAQELEENGNHYELTELSTQEWTKTDRFQSVTQCHTYLEGQEIPESLDVEVQDEVTGETINGTIWRSDLWQDGAAWQEGGLEQWIEYNWNGESWTIEIAGEMHYAAEESPWFDGCEEALLQYLSLDPVFYQITSVEWNGDSWEDEDGNRKRSVHLTGNRMAPRYQAAFSGDIAEADLPMVRYTAHYTSDPQGYLITALVTYKKAEQSFVYDNLSDSELNSKLELAMKPLLDWISVWNQTVETGKLWGLLLVGFSAINIGLQTAVIAALVRKSV